ncbi:BTAD domain-containing putative transcriptional regulator [Kitasatospora sp. NPDC101155]|uniref:AfsR/SARP family transcriptional regulator n=1 Tax=Kitasatospora sp. NPDC101155 TaxID=3364097 RepID=UPI00380FD3C3
MLQVVFRALGPLEIGVAGRPVPLQGARQRTIMSMLLLSPNRAVSVDALADAVWQGRPPATCRNQIAICVSALRKTFKTEAGVDRLIVTSHPGYLLDAAEHRIDTVEFEALVARAREAARAGRAEQACARYQEALALWRGPALEGVTAERVEAEAARLTELRLTAYEEHAGIRLELGQHRELVGELTTFFRDHPLREQATAHLMLAQYRSGRRAEALETYREWHGLLAEELGIAPGPRLRELHEAVLNDAPGLGAPGESVTLAPVTAALSQLPPDAAAFTGRRTELDQLDRLLVKLGGTALPVASISGSGGVGKTALAVHWAHQVGERFPDGRLFADLRGYDEQEDPHRPGAVLDRFLRALGVPGRQIPSEQHERTALFRSLLDGRRVLIVLDNARSFQQIGPLLPGSGRCCVLITSRDGLGGALAGDYAFVPLHLGPLGRDEAVELLARVAGSERLAADPEGTARLAELCDCLPLALRIAGGRLAAKPHWPVRSLVTRLEDGQRRLDELSPGGRGVRAGFGLSYRDLPATAARMFRLLGLLDLPEFAAWTGAALLDTSPTDAEDLIEQLVDARLLEPLGADAGPVRYRFQNLLRLFARERARAEDSEEERRAAVYRAYGAWLGLAGEAHRRLHGGEHGDVHGPARVHPLPADSVEDLLADPLTWFESERAAIAGLVDQAVQEGEPELACDLMTAGVTLFHDGEGQEDWHLCG